jgi:tetratricopeptide (TPR) repeat protein
MSLQMSIMTGIDAGKTERRLGSWKEIAVFFDRDEKTVRRWEKELGLPVHRLPGLSKGRVYAFAPELSEWAKRPRESKADVSADLANESAAESVIEPNEPSQVLVANPILYAGPNPTLGASGEFTTRRALYIAALAPFIILIFGLGGTHSGLRDQGLSLARRMGLISQAASPHAPVHVASANAERLYLEGRYYWNERTAEGFAKAIDDFTQAIVADPQCANAYAGLADSYNLIREYTAMPDEEAFPRAEAAARKAIELDPNLAEGHRALAFPAFWWRHDSITADREYERALALNPNDGTAHLWYANVLSATGRYDKALAEIDRAQELDPSSSSVRADKGRLLYSAGKKTEAIALLRQMKKNEPKFVSPHRYLGQIYLSEGKYGDYLVEAEEVARLANESDDMKLLEEEKKGLAQGGARGFLQVMLGGQEKLYEEEKIPVYTLAQTSAMLGNKTEALQYLMTSRDRHESVLGGLDRDPALRSLRDEPGYQRLVSEVAVPPMK